MSGNVANISLTCLFDFPILRRKKGLQQFFKLTNLADGGAAITTIKSFCFDLRQAVKEAAWIRTEIPAEFIVLSAPV